MSLKHDWRQAMHYNGWYCATCHEQFDQAAARQNGQPSRSPPDTECSGPTEQQKAGKQE